MSMWKLAFKNFKEKSEKLSFTHGIIGVHGSDFSEFSKCD